MKIGIDARLYSQTGIGRYIRNLISSLALVDNKNQYIVFLASEDFHRFQIPGLNWQKVQADFAWHSLKEQIWMPFFLYRYRLDLVHFPYFNVPLLYWKPFAVTLHDLTIWQQPTGKATTRPLWYYWLKKIGYLIELKYIARFSRRIITISHTVKQDIIRLLGVRKNLVTVIYEAVDSSLFFLRGKITISKPYLLVVGNFYPHKNLIRLIFAFRKLTREKKWHDLKLILAGPKDFFYLRLRRTLKDKDLLGKVQFVLNPRDDELGKLYRNAEWLVFPSLAEGFGLPGLEALALKCPVACSNIPVFKEIYHQAPIFFDPKDSDSLWFSLKTALNEPLPDRLKRIKLGLKIASSYSWEKCARQTLEVYENCLSLRPNQ